VNYDTYLVLVMALFSITRVLYHNISLNPLLNEVSPTTHELLLMTVIGKKRRCDRARASQRLYNPDFYPPTLPLRHYSCRRYGLMPSFMSRWGWIVASAGQPQKKRLRKCEMGRKGVGHGPSGMPDIPLVFEL